MNNDIKIPSISSLHHEKSIKETSKIDIYNIVLNKCIEKIIFTNKNTDKTFIIFEIPKILIGYPNYDMKNCILFIINRLSERGYLIEFIEPFYLYIDWGSKPQQQKLKDKNSFSVQKKNLLNKYPDLSKYPDSKIEFVYSESVTSKHNKKNKKRY
jgi:hypothetical protein|uniref:Uncharacterized protein n=1 Tax=viral metagenome TaxID=1070528 RepID=A0A6C0AL74_9ZZZZ